MMKTFAKNFFKCGLLGWSLEILFTALGSLQKRDMRLMGITSLWMFPIYGSLSLLTPIFRALKKLPLFFRGSLYALGIFTGEYLSGSLLDRQKICPWDYGQCRWHIKGRVRLDYFPNWFIAGILYERLLTKGSHTRS